MTSRAPVDARPDAGDGADKRENPAGSIDRRRLLKTAGIAGGALWVVPSVLALDVSPAYASTCSCGGATTAQQFLTQVPDTTPNPLPTACGVPTTGSSTATATLSFCRSDTTQSIYLWGTGSLSSGTNGPLFDDIGVVTVTETRTGGITRYGNIYRFQNYCRHGTNVPTNLVSGYSAAVQRVYTGTDVNTWDYLPPQVTGSTQTVDPTTWWTNSQPGTPNTQSVGNPGYTVATPWPGPIDISLLFGLGCGSFSVTVTDYNRYQQFKWSNIFIGTTHP